MACHGMQRHGMASHYITLHCATLCYAPLHFTALRYIYINIYSLHARAHVQSHAHALHYTTLHYSSMRCSCIALRCIALHIIACGMHRTASHRHAIRNIALQLQCHTLQDNGRLASPATRPRPHASPGSSWYAAIGGHSRRITRRLAPGDPRLGAKPPASLSPHGRMGVAHRPLLLG